ncbi:hypothetical protein FBY40_1562 [Microbacterium sp. SLBN-154]|uniref:protealysin inhibitor emfourin n=1 Tax=Microbacterium sp. SLBN-154 TaxID=2768458 RepID=UPI00114ECCD7|nr:protealysin inhibitor emfourin [Microbacterium sp. SLBN-154]TQK19071.1 hypothetical protein FBY40_1562 [Microbacterium sp. SLBN-154]
MSDQTDGTGPGRKAIVVVLVERTGGVTGIPRRWRAEVEGDDASSWLPLIDACPWDVAPRPTRGADRFRWRVHATSHGADREAEFGDADLEGPWQTLVERVREHGRPG